MPTTTFAHIALNCTDPLAIERFYTTYLGFRRTRVYDPGPNQVVMIRSGSMWLELFKTADGDPQGKPAKDGFTFPGYRHMAFLVDDLDAKLAEIGDHTTVSLGPLDMGQYIPGMRVAWITDPEGNIVELNQGYVDEADPPPLD